MTDGQVVSPSPRQPTHSNAWHSRNGARPVWIADDTRNLANKVSAFIPRVVDTGVN